MEWTSSKLKKLGITLSLVTVTAGVTGGYGFAAVASTLIDSPQPQTASTITVAEDSTAAPAIHSSTPAQTSAPIISGLSEQPRLVGACRYSPERSLDIYADAARTRWLRTLTSPTEGVTLTGVVGTGLAQIQSPVLGWIGTATVEPCTNTTTGATTTTTTTTTTATTPVAVSNSGVCYQVKVSQLTVRTSPDLNASALGVYSGGSIINASTNPPREQVASDDRLWAEVVAPNGTGWIALTGRDGRGENAVRLNDPNCTP